MFNYKKLYFTVSAAILFFAFAAFSTNAQSSDQNFPTPVTSTSLDGTIKARDIGDSRLTTYYFTFEGGQGDIFVNVLTKNLTGDIDIFAAEGLRPLTKIVVYADSSDNETGRVIYLRKSEKIIMRIQGRTPNDDAATFQIKFAGSFLAAAETGENNEPKLPEVAKNNDGDVVVNSVGTIVSVKPKPTPEPKTTVAENPAQQTEVSPVEAVAEQNEEKETPKTVIAEKSEKSSETKEAETIAKTSKKKAKKLEINNETPEESPKPKKEKAKKSEKTAKTETVKSEPAPNPLENIRLVVLLKDGGSIERPMSEIVKFGIEKGILTIVNKNGTISRYSILEVAKVTIE